jgi:hypothetical protein
MISDKDKIAIQAKHEQSQAWARELESIDDFQRLAASMPPAATLDESLKRRAVLMVFGQLCMMQADAMEAEQL